MKANKLTSGQVYRTITHMTRDEVIEHLLAIKGKRKQVELAAELGVSSQYLGDVLAGKRDLGKTILTSLGLEKSIDYRSKEKLEQQ